MGTTLRRARWVTIQHWSRAQKQAQRQAQIQTATSPLPNGYAYHFKTPTKNSLKRWLNQTILTSTL